MKFLECKHYDKIVYDKNRDLPWAKLFTALLAPTKDLVYSEFSDQTKALLHHLWLMAIVWKNRIPADWITKDKLNLKLKPNLNPLLDCGFVRWIDGNGSVVLDPIQESLVRDRDARNKNSFLRTTTEAPREKAKSEVLVESFVLTEKHYAWGKENAPSVPLDVELEAWKDRMRTSGYKTNAGPVRNAQSAFYTACRNAERWGTYTGGKTAAPRVIASAPRVHE